MPRGKSINVYLMDGDVSGRIKCTLANWTGVAFKIPRTSLELCKDRDELKQTGVYFLFGKDEQTEKNVIYVGQAGIRKNGEGILNRLLEHNRNPDKDYWTEAIAITTSNDSLGPTEISYLEHRFYKLACDANRYDVKNGNDPTSGNPSEEKQSELEDFIDYAEVIVGILGHKVFVPLVSKKHSSLSRNNKELYCTGGDVKAVGVRTPDGFVVKKGSQISKKIAISCPEYAIKKRNQYESIIGEDFKLLEDILFSTPSGAAGFVYGASKSGNAVWKTADGVLLKDLDNNSK